MRNKPALTLDDVRAAMTACEAEAKANGWNVSIAIVDEAGALWNLLRMDGAGALTAEVATAKARTAAATGRPTQFWEERIKERSGFLNFPHMLPVTGGVPVLVGTERVGAIGVSGVQSHQDEQIALAGLKALQL
jgi:uncharacterized protein GlcG (DUF336 family)